MTISDISLATSTTPSLQTLTKTTNSLNTTLQRLAGGQKTVTDSTSFSIAKDLLSRLSDLSTGKNSMTNSIVTQNIAQAGYQEVTSLLQSAQAIAVAAESTNDPSELLNYSSRYEAVIFQAYQVAENAGISSSISSLIPSSSLSESSSSELNDSINFIKSQSVSSVSSMGSSPAVQSYSDRVINILQTSSKDLMLTDMNEQAASALALQTQQQLGTTALGVTSKTAESVLRIFA